MKQIDFRLTQPVRLVPMVGTTNVSVRTTGDVLIQECGETEHRQRAVTIVETHKASLKRSPGGMYQTVKIRLRIGEASEHEFHRQLTILFDKMLTENV